MNNVVKENLKEKLKKEFYNELEYYAPDWERIANINQDAARYSNEDMYIRKVECYCEAIKNIRKTRGLTLRQMEEMISYSREQISRAENKIIKKLPLKKMKDIAEIYEVSEAYLLGLVEDESYFPSDTECYFWENPKSKYLAIKDEVIEDSLQFPMIIHGPSKHELAEKVLNRIKDDYEFLRVVDNILNANPVKRKHIISILKYLCKIL